MDANPPLPSAPPPMPKPGGSGKKWILFGCGGCLTLIVLMGLCGAAITFFVFGAIKKTDVYADAMKKAQNSTQVQSAIGTPIESGWWFQGSVNYNNGAGTADFNAPLTGPKGEATLVVKADKSPSEPWHYSVMEVQVTGGEKINLLEAK